jgi:hypothetical protein
MRRSVWGGEMLCVRDYYEVSDDNLRNQVAETRKDYGLREYSHSGFMGEPKTRPTRNSLL